MSQNVVLTPGTDADNSDDIVVASGQAVKVSLYITSDVLDACITPILEKMPDDSYQTLYASKNNSVVLSSDNRQVVITAPGTYRATKVASATTYGVMTES